MTILGGALVPWLDGQPTRMIFLGMIGFGLFGLAITAAPLLFKRQDGSVGVSGRCGQLLVITLASIGLGAVYRFGMPDDLFMERMQLNMVVIGLVFIASCVLVLWRNRRKPPHQNVTEL
jgi:hypothetical protein